jgi:hypothetical protein
MRHLKLLILAAMALCVFGAVGTAIASAEEVLNPAILCLVAGCGTLEVKASGGASKLEDTAGNSLTGTEVASTIKGCEVIAKTEEKDINLCKDVLIVFKGVKNSSGAECKTGAAAKGTVEALLDLHLASELSTSKVLEPLLLAKVLNAELGPELTLTCALVKEVVKGTIGCLLLPGLTNIGLKEKEEVELKCAIKEKGKPLTGECEQLCEQLKENPFEAKLSEKFLPAAMEITLKGKPTKDIFIDD